MYAFDVHFLEVYPKLKPSWRNEVEVTDAISLPIREGFKVVQHNFQSWGKDTGRSERVLQVNSPTLSGDRDLRQ